MRVRLEVMPWLSELLNGNLSQKVTLEETLPEGETLRGLLVRLQEGHGRFGRVVYDPTTGKPTGQAEIAVNGLLYNQVTGLDAPLGDGDTVTFLPGIAGGWDQFPAKLTPATIPHCWGGQ